MKSIYIGWDPREKDACAVAQKSLLKHLSESIPVHKLVLGDLQTRGLYTRPTYRNKAGRLIDVPSIRQDYDGSISTEHANARFFVPHLAKAGWVLFLDGDILVRDDIAKLFNQLEPHYAVYCVKHHYAPISKTKMDDQVQTVYNRKNWSSVMAINCDHSSNKHLKISLINNLPGRDLHRFCWLDDSEIGELDPKWNWLPGHTDPAIDPAIVHFTEGTPDMPGYEDAPYSDEWREMLA